MKLRFIVNARSGNAAKALPKVRAFAARQGATVAMTECPRHGFSLARQAIDDGCELVVAVGGDGTMNEVASALLGSGATFGLVPCGSGDGLGRHLGIHGTVEHALDVLKHRTPRLIDSATADGHAFFTSAGIGFEAEIAARFNRLQRRGFSRYLTTAAAGYWEWSPQTYVIRSAAGRTEVRAFTLTVGNANQYGNGALIAPGAALDDGMLNLTAVPPVTPLNAVPLLVRLFSGSLQRARGVTMLRDAVFTIERPSPGPLHTDGELHEAGKIIEFKVRPSSLRVLCPRSPAGDSTKAPAESPGTGSEFRASPR